MRDLCADGLLAAARLFGHAQFAFLIDVQQRLDLQHRADGRRRGGNASAVLEVIKGIDGEPVADFQAVFFHPRGQLFDGQALLLLAGSFADEHRFADGGAEGIHDDQLALRVFLAKFLCAQVGGLQRTRQAGGEAQVEDVFARLERLFKTLAIDHRIDLRCAGKLARPLLGIEMLDGQIAAGAVDIVFAAKLYLHRHKLDFRHAAHQLFADVGRHVAEQFVSHRDSLLRVCPARGVKLYLLYAVKCGLAIPQMGENGGISRSFSIRR